MVSPEVRNRNWSHDRRLLYTTGDEKGQDVQFREAQPVKGKTVTRLVSVITDVSIYASGDAVGQMLVFPGIVDAIGAGGIIESVMLIDRDSEDVAAALVLFDRPFVPTADQAAFTPADADLENYVGRVLIADYATFANNSVGQALGVGLAFNCYQTSLYGQLVTRGAPTYTAAADLRVKLTIVQA